MKLFLFISLFFSSLCLFAQKDITGTILNKETGEPIPYVAIYTNNHSAISDENGHYNLKINNAETVHFQHLAYNLFVASSDSLVHNTTVNLVPHTVELGEVTISPIDAQFLLSKAVQNLNKNLMRKKAKSYLFHVAESNTLKKEKEVNALIDVTFNRLNTITKDYIWDSNLLCLDRSQDDFYGKIRIPIRIELFPNNFDGSKSDDYINDLQDNNPNYFTIKVTPKHLNKKDYRYYLYTINKQDTVLVEFVSQSLSNATQLAQYDIKKININIINYFSKVNISQNEETGYYAIQDVKNLGTFNVKTADSDYNVIFQSDVSTWNGTVPQGVFKKKVSLYDDALFKIDFPNSPGFWKQYVKP